MRSALDGAVRLRQALQAEGGTVAELLVGPDRADPTLSSPGPAQIAASGPRAGGRGAEYEVLLEMILEGSRLHYGEPHVVSTAEPDLALLVGDQLYALGLSRLAAIGDLDAVYELADVISLVAQAQAGGNRELAGVVWDAGAVAVGWGSSDDHHQAKSLARRGAADAIEALRAVAFAPRPPATS